MKAITMAAQNMQTGVRGLMIAGGMESMTNTPYVYNWLSCPADSAAVTTLFALDRRFSTC
jgi:acetyl-CoA acetyltransferase